MLNDLQVLVGTNKIIGGGVIGVGVKIREDRIDIHSVLAAISRIKSCIMGPGVGNAGSLIGRQICDPLIFGEFVDRAVVDGVHGLHFAHRLGKVNGNSFHRHPSLRKG